MSIRRPFAWLISEHRMLGGLDTLLEGVLLGGVYALFAVGLSLIFRIMRLVNLAHGDIIVLAAYLILTAIAVAGVSLGLATFLTILVMFVAGFALQGLVRGGGGGGVTRPRCR